MLGPQAQVSGPAFIINEEARSHRNELRMRQLAQAGTAPASRYTADMVYLWCDFHSFLFRPLPCGPDDEREEQDFQ